MCFINTVLGIRYTFKSELGEIKMIILKWILIIFLILCLVDFLMISFYVGCLFIVDSSRRKKAEQDEQL